ncbi:uncharacterized protein BDR25DRAFT_46991 [Lindgomyces ingoldianus]|uniref:Uncharacterized protein n=1 Tax=Lindgomyces ingoldianus TaxID=673940 RepID=A0ACB6QRN3_9PLEO|nr:uncharacterized protein BDR25DRAFT_46991 [Lindgomyces ingoldianus]KAF2469668.1 hypothetical protein BDR25DRAFT_46991 [Lindgomyces ingoldianus]
MKRIISRSSFVALAWISAAFATSCESRRPHLHPHSSLNGTSVVIAEPIESRDLEIRATSKCPDKYTTRNGMNFTTYCEQNNPFNDALDPFQVGSMEECMERCSRYWGNGEGCFGIVWREDQYCWIRNSTVSTAGITNETGIHSALVEAKDMKPLNQDCPFDDLSTHDLNNGIGYTVHCGKVIGNNDACFQGYPSCLPSPFIGYYHATSLQDCLNICVEQHPLCRAVSYNPGLEIGFANCWPKTGFENFGDPTSNMGVLHSAALTSIERIDSTCPSDKSYTAQGNKKFEIHCGQLNGGTNITSIHRQNITACMNACANSDKGCVGIVFDSTLAYGYNNCYLQNTTSVISDQASATYAILSGSSIPSSSGTPPPGGNSDSGGSSSKAWIAGPVVGGIVAIAIIAFAAFWWRRRKNAKVKQEYAPAPAYSPYSGPGGGVDMTNHPGAPLSELGGYHTVEMATSEYQPVTKYAHANEPHGETPQELPT